MLTTILIFIVILGLLVFVHEFGHFIVAKKSGMRVLEFGFGFPPRLIGFQKIDGKWSVILGYRSPLPNPPPQGEGIIHGTSSLSSPADGEEVGGGEDSTIYSINAIPLGGFVKIWGENNEHEGDPRSFINRPFWARFLTLVAGVAMNVVLAWVIISIGLIIGLKAKIESPSQIPKGAILKNPQVIIEKAIEQKPAHIAGLMAGDVILEIDGNPLADYSAARQYISTSKTSEITVKVLRENRELFVAVSPETNPETQEKFIGVELANLGTISFPAHLAFIKGVKFTGIQLLNIGYGLFGLLRGEIGLENVGGPVKIAQLTGQVAKQGLSSLMQFTAFLSLNLAILNLLPFPALDGGRVFFLIIEKLRRKRNNPRIEQAVNAAGFAFLILLMVLVTIKDVKGIGN